MLVFGCNGKMNWASRIICYYYPSNVGPGSSIQDDMDIKASIKPAFKRGFPFLSLIETPLD